MLSKEDYRCTECNGDAAMAFVPETIKRGKKKGEQRASWMAKFCPVKGYVFHVDVNED